tara:strand:- start:227 stop:442 length:216 start_codon:yes stop_codon:yes gene_type:complete
VGLLVVVAVVVIMDQCLHLALVELEDQVAVEQVDQILLLVLVELQELQTLAVVVAVKEVDQHLQQQVDQVS